MVRFNLILIALAVHGQEIALEKGKTYERTLAPGAVDTFTARVAKGDRVVARLQSKDAKKDLILSFVGPSGKLQRATSTKIAGGGPFEFVAQETGNWRVTVAARLKDSEAAYTLSGFETGPLPQLPVIPAPKKSERIARLQTQQQVDAFFQEIGPAGGPVIEPIEGGTTHMLVSFVYRGNPETKRVLVQTELCGDPDDCLMKRVEGTDLWYLTLRVDRRMRTPYSFIVNAPDGSAMRKLAQEGISDDTLPLAMSYYQRAQLLSQRDPLNPKGWMAPPDSPDPVIYQGRSLLEMPAAPRQPWAAKRADVPEGKVTQTEIVSAILKNRRALHIYTPPGYSADAKPYPLVLVFDGITYVNTVPTPVTLDNLLADKRIGPVVAVMIGNSGNRRNFELPCNPEFADFLAKELVPWVRSQYNVTADPKQVVVGGSSYGGLAATCAAFRYPEVFGNVLSQSGSYWWTPPRDPDKEFGFAPDAIPTHIADMFVKSPRLPIRFYLDAGTLEVDRSGKGSGILVPNRHLRDVLRAKGYEVFHQEFVGGHDYASWRGTIADGLILLLGPTPTPALQR